MTMQDYVLGGGFRMTVQVAVVDPLPMFARGLVETLNDEGHRAGTPEDIVGWVRGSGFPTVLLTISDERGWALLADILRVRPDAAVIAVLPVADAEAYVRALAAGAVGVLPREAPPGTVRDAVRAVLAGRSLLPIEVIRRLLAGQEYEDPPRPLSDEEITWLRQLADGSTVASLADRVGYSERMMYRLLSKLYTRIGAANRTRAIMLARDRGWV
jgi:DNA-binding NarL/FixJ family response regulator